MSAAASSSSRGRIGPRCTTVTSAPSRRCAWASSMPTGPPPSTRRCPGVSSRSKIVSLVRNGRRSRPGGERAAPPGAGAGRQHDPARPHANAAALQQQPPADEAGRRLDHAHAKPFEALDAVMRRNVGDDALHMAPERGGIDPGRLRGDAEAAGIAERRGGVGGCDGGLGRHTAVVQAVAAHPALLEQQHRGRPSAPRRPPRRARLSRRRRPRYRPEPSPSSARLPADRYAGPFHASLPFRKSGYLM